MVERLVSYYQELEAATTEYERAKTVAIALLQHAQETPVLWLDAQQVSSVIRTYGAAGNRYHMILTDAIYYFSHVYDGDSILQQKELWKRWEELFKEYKQLLIKLDKICQQYSYAVIQMFRQQHTE